MGLSTFSTLQSAARGLDVARHQIAVTAQNVSNAGTVGYTRQSATLQTVPGLRGAGLVASPASPGEGVQVAGIERHTSALLDRQVRTALAQTGFQQVRAAAYADVEDVLGEPGDRSVSAAVNAYHAAWQDLSNHPEQSGRAVVLLQAASTLASRLGADHRALAGQFETQSQALTSEVDRVNALAAHLAEVNVAVRQASNSGGPGAAHPLMDERDRIAEQLASLTGGQMRLGADGTATFLVGGNPLVAADVAQRLVVEPADGAQPGEPVTVAWSHRPGSAGLDGGSLAARLSVLSPEGPLVGAMNAYDELATRLAEDTNALHSTGVTTSGEPGGAFFALGPGSPAATLRVAVTGVEQLAAAAPGAGTLDGQVADAISRLDGQVSAPWAGFVAGTGAASRSALEGLALATTTEMSARSSQQALSSVDLDEETVNLVAFQHAYQASARVLSAVDEMLDVLINRTGVVGR